MSRIVARHVSKLYGTAEGGAVTRALTDLDLVVNDNEILCVVGPSGCGKSTFLNLVAGFIQPTHGELTVDGKAVQAPGPDRGVVFQEDALFPWLSAVENVAFGPQLRGIRRSVATKQAMESLKLVGLEGFEHHLPKALSGGMKQRVAISRVLVNDPDVLLLDEPFSALDTFTRTTLQSELLRIWEHRKRTFVFVTHNVEEAVLLGTRVAVMAKTPDGGTLVQDISIQLSRPRDMTSAEFNDYKRQILTALNMDARL
jgi:NitT/TauT family transport system ATP-binding protein